MALHTHPPPFGNSVEAVSPTQTSILTKLFEPNFWGLNVFKLKRYLD